MYNQGINREGSIIDAGLRFGVLGKKARGFSMMAS